MSTFNDTGTCIESSQVKNEDGTWTFTAKIIGLTAEWGISPEYILDSEVLITVHAPDTFSLPGTNNVFRLDSGYNIEITGQDWS